MPGKQDTGYQQMDEATYNSIYGPAPVGGNGNSGAYSSGERTPLARQLGNLPTYAGQQAEQGWKQQAGESREAWLKRLRAEAVRNPYGMAAQNLRADQQTNADNTEAELRKFYDAINKPLDMNDPYVKQATNAASSYSNMQSRARGVDGGLSARGASQAALGQYTNLDMQRRQMAQSALGNLASYQNQRTAVGQQYDQSAAQNAQQQYLNNQREAARLAGVKAQEENNQWWRRVMSEASSIGGGVGAGITGNGGSAKTWSDSGRQHANNWSGGNNYNPYTGEGL